MNRRLHTYAWLTGSTVAAILGAAPGYALPPTTRGPASPGQTGIPEIPGPQLTESALPQPARTPFSRVRETAPLPAFPAPAARPAETFPAPPETLTARLPETLSPASRPEPPESAVLQPARATGDAARVRTSLPQVGGKGALPDTTRPTRDAQVLLEIAAYENSRQYRLEQNKVNFSTFSAGSPYEKLVTLTFDDGPEPKYTPEILRILKKMKVPATFFVIGRKVDKYPEIVRQTAADGHDLGNHTYHHFDLRPLGEAGVRFEIQRTSQSIERVVGGPTRWFRAPGCRYTPEILQVLNDLDMVRVDTTLNSGDWAKKESKEIVERILKGLSPGDVILVHDRLNLTVKALPGVIRAIRAKGYRFVPLTTLALRAQSTPGFRPPFWPSHQGIVIDDPKRRAFPGKPKRRVKKRVVPYSVAYNSLPEDVSPSTLAAAAAPKRVTPRRRALRAAPVSAPAAKARPAMGPPYLPASSKAPVKRVLPQSRLSRLPGSMGLTTP